MYRHFAVVTILFTLTLAIFASGEQDQLAQQATQAKALNTAKNESNKVEQKRTLLVSPAAKKRRASSSSSSSARISMGYGVPMDQVGAEIQDMQGGNADFFVGDVDEELRSTNIPPGISPSVWADLNEQQRKRAWEVFGSGNQMSSEERLKRQQEMIAASAIRARR